MECFTKDELIPTRATLLHRLKDWQDQLSWQDFFDTYWRLMYTFALKSGLTETEAQDVVQETMISVAKHMPTFQYDPANGSFKTWLFNLMRWRITDQFRKRSAEARLSSRTNRIEKLIDPVTDLFAFWDSQWEQNLVSAAISNIKRRSDPQKFQIFDLYVNKRWNPAKIAKSFGIPVAQVYLAKHRVTGLIRHEVRRLERHAT